ncbi:transcription termination/antitermination protein NusA [Candidatus Shapirobacteria bacterium CG09_land_8_20_14_0_10_39_12]|uniref:Transcription termination/antitermination protein NusA n=1 Tax=Candidatus Shapirobacteria bacterium CG09_land_8_20_14_0_10_39_12 TaxID=1974885 RepID=A0A2H0WPT3_9BACT|nr:MAG: transcription termination/antitermination protein NusA [Candidatus Shapirobacteria bacterium CG09_land_8_20_14_0_10_39_12]
MANVNIPRTEFAAALAQVASERGIDTSAVLESIKLAIITAYKKDYGTSDEFEYDVLVDPTTGESKLFSWPIGQEEKKKEITPAGFGRIAAQQARNIIVQKIREAEKNSILEEYEKKVGILINGMILRFEGENILVDLGKGEAIMPASEQNKAESYHLNMRLTFYVEGIRETLKGKQIIVSRSHTGLVGGLFKREVPEVSSGAVEIKEIAREAGSRTKIAVYSKTPGVDPVGSCVGQKGVRVQAVIAELSGEKIDIVQYNEDPEKFIVSSLSPAENLTVKINESKKTALISAPEDQLSLAIGKGGQNVRLASKLTGYKIDIQGNEEAVKVEEKVAEKPKKTKKKEKKEKTS